MMRSRFNLFTVLIFLMPTIWGAPGITAPAVFRAAAGKVSELDYEFRFQGNNHISRKKLEQAARSELKDFKEEGYQQADIDDAAFQMRLFYHQQGYAFSEVDYLYETGADKVSVTFKISEGPRVLVKDIKFEGVSAFEKETLLAFFDLENQGLLSTGKPIFIESEIEKAVSEIRNFYLENGYQDIRIEKPEIVFSENRKLATIRIDLREGPHYFIKDTVFKGDIYPETEKLLDRIARDLRDKVYFRRRDLELRSRILEVYGNNGYPDTGLRLTREEREPGKIILKAQIMSGPRVWIEKVKITGNNQTRNSFIRSRLKLQVGELYSAGKQRRSFRELYRTGLFSRVDITLNKGSDRNHRLLLVKVEESPAREVSMEVGWGAYEMLRGKLGFRAKNLLGKGRVFRTEVGGSFKHREIQVGITDPWLLGSGITADLPFSYRQREEPSFTRTEFDSSLLLSRRLSPDTTTSLGYNYRITELSDLSVAESTEDFDRNYNLGSLELQLTNDTRNNIFFPTSGQRFYVSGETSDTVLGSEINFFRFTTGIRRFFPLTRQLALGLRYNTGFLLPTRQQDNIPLGERFYSGGENTIRSFRQNQLGPVDEEGEAVGGLAFNILSTELRYRISGPFIGTLFFDYGNISPNQSHDEQDENLFGTSQSELISATFNDYFQDFRPAVGFGLQYMLPVGPIRLDIAFNPDYRDNERDYSIHLSVGQAF